MIRHRSGSPAGIQYHGLPGISQACKKAVVRLVQCHEEIARARILTCASSHCLLLTLGVSNLVAVKSGFSSGYAGEGPRAFSYVLQLLHSHHVEIEEIIVSEDLIKCLDSSALSSLDIDAIEAARPVRPMRWHEFTFEYDLETSDRGEQWRDFPPVIPFAIIDRRIADLALRFWDRPDDSILVGYRRLEDIVRTRTQIDEHGAKLFSQAFLGQGAKLCWKDLGDREQQGRGSLFAATYMAYRNPRAHRELAADANGLLAEFLLLNQLYLLEGDAQERVEDVPPSSSLGAD